MEYLFRTFGAASFSLIGRHARTSCSLGGGSSSPWLKWGSTRSIRRTPLPAWLRHGYGLDEVTPEHSTISRTRRLIDLETHRAVFTWILQVLATADLIRGKTIGIDAEVVDAFVGAVPCIGNLLSRGG